MNLRNRNIKLQSLKSLIEEQKVVIVEEGAKLKRLNETKKEKNIDFENQVSSYREELLKIKREKHNLNESMKEQKNQIEALEKEAEDLKLDKEILKGMVEKTKVALEEENSRT